MKLKEKRIWRNVKTYLDSTDLEILEVLENHSGIGVIRLTEILDIKHESLKRHLRKLYACHLILLTGGAKPNSLRIYDIETSSFDYKTGKVIFDPEPSSTSSDEERKIKEAAANIKAALRKIRLHLARTENEESKTLADDLEEGLDAINI